MSKFQQTKVESDLIDEKNEIFESPYENRSKDLSDARSSIDYYVGQKLRNYREKVGLTLKDCSKRLGISHQQIHKYEAGQTKIPSGMLYKFSKLFSITPNSFFEGYMGDQDSPDLPKQIDITTYPKSKKINVLLLDNNSQDQFLVTQSLNDYSDRINLYCIHDGQELINIVKRRSTINVIPIPDLILFDLNIPKMEGSSILKYIKHDKDLRHIPVLVLTSSINIKDVMDSYKNYASGYIRKSFDCGVFEKHIKLAMNYWIDAVVLPHHEWARVKP